MVIPNALPLIDTRIEKIKLWLILGILFFIPISPAAPSLLGFMLIIAWSIEGRFSEKWAYLSRHPLFWAMLAYLLIYPLSILWSNNTEWGWHIVERHMIYLLFPFLLSSLRVEHMKTYLLAFILGVTFTEITSYAVWFELLHLEGVSAANPTPFYGHTEYNPILAWTLFLLMSSLFFTKNSTLMTGIIALFIITMTINMFITGGRGGQVTFLVIALLVIWQFFSLNQMRIKGVFVGIGVVITMFTIAYQFSPLFESRVDRAVTEVIHFDETKCAGSVGNRLCMYLNTAKMSVERPFLGSGIGDFPEDYTKFVGPDAAFKLVASKNIGHSHPHNQFLYELGALGLAGLAVLLSILLIQFLIGLTWKDAYQPYRIAFVVYIGVVMLSDSLLLAHPTALVFISFSAILFFSPINADSHHDTSERTEKN